MCQWFFLHKGCQKSAKGKITLSEPHMQWKLHFTAYLQGFVNIQSPKHQKTNSFCFLKIVCFFFPHWKWKTRKKRGKKSPAKSNLECWGSYLWFSIVIHCSFFGFSLFFLWFLIVFSSVSLWCVPWFSINPFPPILTRPFPNTKH